MSLRKKFIKGMQSYCENTLLPVCYAVAVRHGFVGDLDDFNREVLAEMKKVQEGCYVPSPSEVQ